VVEHVLRLGPVAVAGNGVVNDDAMPVDPHIAGLLELIAASGYPPMHQGTPEDGRRAMRAMTSDLVRPEDVIAVKEVQEVTVPGGAGDRPARLYRPAGAGPFPTTVYFHGGGFVTGDLDTHDQSCRRLCRDARTVVLSVDYRLAPEHPFPAGVEDALAAVRWVADHLDELGGDDRLAVGGDSAGGNLSAVVAQAMPERITAQLLVYPAVDMAGDYPSRVENARGYFLDMQVMEWFFLHYVADVPGVDPQDPRLSPLHATSLEGQPPAVVVTAELDPLRDEGEAYAEKLAEAGVEVVVKRYDGLIHGFLDMTFSPAAEAAVAECVDRFAELLHR
jgi:acetyl esterase